MCALGAAALSATPAVAAGTNTHWTWLGAAPADGTVSLALPLKANVAGLERFATAVSDPTSPQYGQYDSIADLARRFGAPPAERARVLGYLRRAGASAVKVDVTGLFADATMRVAQAGRMFGTTLGDFRTADANAHVARLHGPRERRADPGGAARRRDRRGGPRHPAAVRILDSPVDVRARRVPAQGGRAAGTETADDLSGYTNRTGTPSGCKPRRLAAGLHPQPVPDRLQLRPAAERGPGRARASAWR